MSPFDDDQDMATDVDDLLSGPVGADRELSAFVAALRATGAGPGPAPSPELLAFMTRGENPGTADGPRSTSSLVTVPAGDDLTDRRASRWRSATRYGVGLGLAAKIVLVAGAAAATVTGAATIEGVPSAVQDPARRLVSEVVELVVPGDHPTPWPLPSRPASDQPTGDGGATVGRDGSDGARAPLELRPQAGHDRQGGGSATTVPVPPATAGPRATVEGRPGAAVPANPGKSSATHGITRPGPSTPATPPVGDASDGAPGGDDSGSARRPKG